ncbi:hypothetical protein, partial [Nonomuraea terrae]|uniref:hypothetical protein n=1 Tax=Nonomuraea terrae TaxID=2530383 RepID=UPI0014052DFA
LGEEWDGLVGGAPVSVLAALVTLGRPSSLFINRVAVELLDREPPDPRPLVLAYGAFPEAFQQLLAEHPRETDLLLTAAGGDEALATALHGALRPYAGADGLRERAWLNVVRAVGAHDDAPGAAVRLVLAEDVTPYLGRLAQARDGAQPSPPWDRLDAETAARFLGALRLRSH